VRSITEFFVCRADCPVCLGEGTICENHPGRAWGPVIGPEDGSEVDELGACHCGGAGMPCPGRF
jgi:hypothetical protein